MVPVKSSETAGGVSQIEYSVLDCSGMEFLLSAPIPFAGLTFVFRSILGSAAILPIQSLFWTENAIYCVVYHIDRPETVPFWLNCVRTHAPTASVILVATHIDTKSTSRESSNEAALRVLKANKSTNTHLRKSVAVSSITGNGISEFLRYLRETAIKQGDVSLGVSKETVLFNSFILRQRMALLDLDMTPVLSWEGADTFEMFFARFELFQIGSDRLSCI